MGTSDVNAIDLLIDVIRDNTPASIWTGSPLEPYRYVGNTNRGEIGEEFVRRYLRGNGINVSNGSRTASTDLRVSGIICEVKTASLGAKGTFQFNHIRLDKPYLYLLCLSVCPRKIVFNAWRKGEIAEGEAGSLVRMAEGQSVTFKLTKKLDDMRPVNDLPSWARTLSD